MQLVLEESEKKLSSDELNEFNRTFGGKIPLSFISFYMNFNGGYPPDNGESNYFLLGGFNPIKHGDLPIEDVYSDLIDDFPDFKNMIPFAYDEGGNCFLLSLGDDDYENIYIWLMDEKELEFISDTFEHFIEKLSQSC